MHYRPNQTRKFRLLYSFGTSGSGNGAFPQSGSIVNGAIYGTTGFGGTNDNGIVFSLPSLRTTNGKKRFCIVSPAETMAAHRLVSSFRTSKAVYMEYASGVARRAEEWFLKSHLSPSVRYARLALHSW
jgi:uncharacterized repeat protein (TIGR03803 family)